MKHYRIVNIGEILRQKQGTVFRGEIGVFVPGDTENFSLAGGLPVYVNAFSYMLLLQGEAECRIDGQSYVLGEHMLCLISPLHLTEFTRVSAGCKCLFLCIHKNFVDGMGAFDFRNRITKGMNLHRSPVVPLRAEDASVLKACMEDVSRQIVREGHLYQLELVQNALMRFYLELDNIMDRQRPAAPDSVMQPRYQFVLQEFITLLMNHYRKEHHVAYYADALHMSTQYLNSIVKSQTGKTVNTFICELIYSEARNMLSSTDFSIQQVTAKLHFADQASFSKFFKRHSGVSPQKFRALSGCNDDCEQPDLAIMR